MAGNSQRRGAIRKAKKGPQLGSGGQPKRALTGKGPTPPAEARKGHPAARRAAAADRRADERTSGRRGDAGEGRRGDPRRSDARRNDARRGDTKRGGTRDAPTPELLVGRNPVAEALRVGVPATALYLAHGLDSDERVTEAVRLASDRGIALLEVSRAELDRRTNGVLHQGIALQVPPFVYHELPDLLAEAAASGTPPLLVALDGVTDPRNLGAVIRSALAFGAHGVIVPERRSAGITATAWRTSAGMAARLPVAQVTNLVRALKDCRDAGMFVLGLDADGTTSLDDLEMATEPVVVVVGSEGRGLSRLVGETCDLTVSIPMAAAAESLNASVAAAVTLADVARRRRA